MSANTEKCADKTKAVCDFNEFARLDYHQGMLLSDADFKAEQRYHIGKRKFLNRMLHGSGVVCGLGITGELDGQFIEVGSGFALDCSGNEIWVSHPVKIDLSSLLPRKVKPNQAECEEKVEERPGEHYIGIRYDEKGTNPVSIYLPSGGCEERTCVNSRYKEGYCIEVVDCCIRPKEDAVDRGLRGLLSNSNSLDPRGEAQGGRPMATCGHCEKYQGEARARCLELEKRCEQSVPCPECCSCDSACAVVLGKITVDEELRLKKICLNDCRKYVLTGNLMRHLFLGMTDSNGNEDLEQVVNNPIKALCAFLTRIIVEQQKVPLPYWVSREEAPPPNPALPARDNAKAPGSGADARVAGGAESTVAGTADSTAAGDAGTTATSEAVTVKPKGKGK